MKIDGKVLKKLREENGLSLRAFAQKIYASKSSVQRWEKSSLPEDGELIERIAKVFGKTTEELEKLSAESEDKLSPERLAELKYGVKWLILPLAVLPVLMILGIVTALIILISI